MLNFEYCNPTKIVFGRNTIAKLGALIPNDKKILMTYGQGSIKRNGVYDSVRAALQEHDVVEFGGIEANPWYETLMKAVDLVRANGVEFLLAVGGGSVLDGTKFIAAAARFEGEDPWDILAQGAAVTSAIPLASVLTLPATGSEFNPNSVISRKASREKRYFGSPHVYPVFSVLDPETTYSLPPRQLCNGIADSYVHVLEQYLTYPTAALLQDRQAEAILLALIDAAPEIMAEKPDYEARANFMWCAALALNGLIGCGVPQDWSTHVIGHELTALYGIDHAQSLVIVAPSLLRHQRDNKRDKLLQYGRRVWQLQDADEDRLIESAIDRTEEFFRSLGMATRLSEYDIDVQDAAVRVSERIDRSGMKLGERRQISPEHVADILRMSG
ncbi:iron-containing alcohol dehydrogenase [Planctomycetota bacterium]